MEQNKKQILRGDCPRKLDLNLPLLSTRRPFAITTNNLPTYAHMVPFSWERIPGEPKDKDANDDVDFPPPPRPPPGRQPLPVNRSCDYNDRINDVSDDDGFCGKGCSRDQRFSDTIDIFSLAESTDYVESNCEKATKDRSPDKPNFIIERFLPDAQALAEASIINKKIPFLSSPDHESRGSFRSPKGCGLGSIFPWRKMPKPCSVKSPVCDTTIGTNQRKGGLCSRKTS